MVENKLKERWKAGKEVVNGWLAIPSGNASHSCRSSPLRFRRHFSFSCLSKVTEQVSVLGKIRAGSRAAMTSRCPR